jgi:hypothetical protein
MRAGELVPNVDNPVATLTSPSPSASLAPSPSPSPPPSRLPSPSPTPPAQQGPPFSGEGVGQTPTFNATRPFGFKWTPNKGIVMGSLHGTVNGQPWGWTFDNNVNPYYPNNPPPDIPGDSVFSIDNIAPGTHWTITVLS